MKIKRLALFLCVPFLLTGCNDEPSVRPEDSDDTKTTNPTIPDSSTISGGSLVAGIKTEELEEAIEVMKENTINISSKSVAYVKESYDYKGDLANAAEVKKNTFNQTDRYFEGNSVRVITNTAPSSDDFKAFGYYDETYGNRINSYIFVNFDTNMIEERDVYSKDGEAALNVKKSVEVDWTLSSYDAYFNLSMETFTIETALENIIVAGKLSTGEIYVRGSIQHSETLDPTYNVTLVSDVFMEIYILNENLTRVAYLYQDVLVGPDSVNYPYETTSIKADYQTTKNGNFDREGSLPVITVE